MALPGGLIALQTVAVYASGGLGAALWILGAFLVILLPLFYLGWRSWTTVGVAGITTYWGFGRARTLG